MKEDAKNGELTFPLDKLFEQFKERRRELGLEETSLRTTDLKEKILKEFGSDITIIGENRERKTLVFKSDLNFIVKEATMKRSMDKDMHAIVEAAKVVRKDIFSLDPIQQEILH